MLLVHFTSRAWTARWSSYQRTTAWACLIQMAAASSSPSAGCDRLAYV
jgi:hypothetical protein